MDERTERRIIEKAEYVGDALEVLADKRDSLTFEDYRTQREERDVVEREFETAIEACIDIGTMILRHEEVEVPETNARVFGMLGELGVLDTDTANRMAEAAGFRNILAHRYGIEIDDEDVYNVLETELPLFRTYLSAVRKSLG